MKTRFQIAAPARRHALRSLVLAAGLAAIAPAHADTGSTAGLGCRFVDPNGIEIAPADQDMTQRLAVLHCERHAERRAQQDAERMERIRQEADTLRVSRHVQNGLAASGLQPQRGPWMPPSGVPGRP